MRTCGDRTSRIGAAIATKCVPAGANVIVHGNPDYDTEREYSDASDSFGTDLAEAYHFKAIAPSDLSMPDELTKVIIKARESLGYLEGV